MIGSAILKRFVRYALGSLGYELKPILAHPPFIPYLKSYDLDYGAMKKCRFDFWLANRDASEWYDDLFFSADDPVWELKAFSQLVQPDSRVVEIGCHHGFLTMMLAHLASDKGRVVSLDANPENVIAAQANVFLNRLQNVDVLFTAGGERKGIAHFEFRTNAHQIANPISNTSAPSYAANVTTVDALVRRYGSFDVLKIDVEGFECEVLRGAKELLKTKPALIIEVHPTQMREHNANGSVPELLNLIGASEYEGTIICRPEFAKVIPFSPNAIPVDRVSNIHLRPIR